MPFLPPWRYFNPRSREGSDGNAYEYGEDEGISIHAPVKGATQQSSEKRITALFQSTLP